MPKRCAALALVVLVSELGHAEDKQGLEKLNHTVIATLTASSKAVKVGEVPVFMLTVENKGMESVRLVDGGQEDLQSVWYDIQVFEDGKPVSLPTRLPGVPFMDDKSYVTVKPGTKVEFQLKRFALRVNKLPAGQYKAQIKFRLESMDQKNHAFQDSSLAEFTVEK